MILTRFFLLLLTTLPGNCQNSFLLPPTMVIVILARNKEHTLPHFLKLVEDLEYPKTRISLFIRSDHNIDRTSGILESWVQKVEKYYHSVDVAIVDHDEEEFPTVIWTRERFLWLIKLKEDALAYSKRVWADWVWFLDADAFITDPETPLIFSSMTDEVVVGPMLQSVGQYSNFWAGMSDSFYYLRTDDYERILNRKTQGCHVVPMLHSSVFINLNHPDAEYLTFLPEKILDSPEDDIIVFALSARFNDIDITVCNDRKYGYIMLPLGETQSLSEDEENLLNLRLVTVETENSRKLPHLPELDRFVARPYMYKDRLGMDKVYVINLERRTDRRRRMEICLEELGIEVEWISAVDGKTLNQDFLDQRGIRMMSDFSEPYHKRPLKYGEIGCFLSHYYIWEDILAKDYQRVLIFEDDIKFETYFRPKLERLMEELTERMDWDLVFLGRKILQNSDEPWVEGSSQLVQVDYTYWTLSYILTQNGAKKLVEEEPLGKMVPVDEYIPIMFDRHPNETWKSHYHHRNLKAFSVHPLLVHPTHYTGDEGYISDTEDSFKIRDEL